MAIQMVPLRGTLVGKLFEHILFGNYLLKFILRTNLRLPGHRPFGMTSGHPFSIL